jgi:glutamate-5-semialdehyde dehydrogenase
MDIKAFVLERALEAKKGARAMGRATSDQKDQALLGMAAAIRKDAARLIEENRKDVAQAEQKGLSKPMVERLTLNEKRIEEMALGLEEVARLTDPVGEVTRSWLRPNGMRVGRMRVPIGVIGIIYESRPNVTADATALCLKSGNAVLLRGGSEAINSNRAIVGVLRAAIADAGIHEGAVTFMDTTEREAVMEMLKLEGMVDLIIPRGGESLIRAVTENSRIPVLKHYKGVCHIFVDRDADLAMAEAVCINAKCQRPSTCNAMETMLVDEPVAAAFLPGVLKKMGEMGVEIRGCERTRALYPAAKPVREEDFHMEYLDLVLNVKVVGGMDEAMEHIAHYGSAHTDGIVTRDHGRAVRFQREVDSSSVMVNVSTRFSDGFQYGLGAEIGIATDKIHARGPMGLEELTCTKFVVTGDGQLRG